jgi:transposase
MSLPERERAYVVRQVASGQFSQGVAAERLGIGLRQMKRLMRQWRASGDVGLVSRQRGHRSNRSLTSDFHSVLEEHLRGQYQGFGATLAAEKLAERDGIKVSAATVRRAQIRFGLWRPKSRRQKRLHQLCERRPRFGELIQIDGSPHAWFEDRGPRCTLIVFIDDATNRLTALIFALRRRHEPIWKRCAATCWSMAARWRFIRIAHGIFRVNAKDAKSGDGKTEFGRVADRLGIEPIHALTPQAKGRVERANQTLQDRLVKEMRLQNISSIEAAHGFLPTFIASWNGRFAIPPRVEPSAHRPWMATPEALDDVLARRQDRVLSKALTFSSEGTKYCVKTSGPGTALRGATVTLYHFIGGGMTVHYKDRILQATAYGTYPVPDPAEDEKTIDARVDRLVAKAARQATEGKILAAT